MPGHFNCKGEAAMVDVGAKPITRREAVARGVVRMSAKALRLLRTGGLSKGDGFAAARIAGILAAKKTGGLIPLCHPLPLDCVEIDLRAVRGGVQVEAAARTTARTGVEMEALTAVSVACLTLYDMAKSVDRAMTIGPIYLQKKSGGRSGLYVRRAAGNGRR